MTEERFLNRIGMFPDGTQKYLLIKTAVDTVCSLKANGVRKVRPIDLFREVSMELQSSVGAAKTALATAIKRTNLRTDTGRHLTVTQFIKYVEDMCCGEEEYF